MMNTTDIVLAFAQINLNCGLICKKQTNNQCLSGHALMKIMFTGLDPFGLLGNVTSPQKTYHGKRKQQYSQPMETMKCFRYS